MPGARLKIDARIARHFDVARRNSKLFAQDTILLGFSQIFSGTGALTKTMGDDILLTHWISHKSMKRCHKEIRSTGGKAMIINALNDRWDCLFPNFHKLGNKVLIGTSVREPIARQLSAFVRLRYIADRKSIMDAPIEEIHNMFKRTCEKNRGITTDWFDKTYYPETGIDVYERSFNKTAGFGIVNGGANISGFILKAEAAKEVGKTADILTALRDFTGLPCPAIITETNYDASATGVEYNSRYREIVDTFVADGEYLDYVYNTKYVRHFYTDAEIAAFRDKWLHQTSELSDIA